FITQGLMTSGKIDDAEAAHRQSNVTLRVRSLIVRSAMYHCRTHSPQHVIVDLGVLVKFYEARNSTHRSPGLAAMVFQVVMLLGQSKPVNGAENVPRNLLLV